MGLEIEKNEEGLYKLTSSISGESYHPDKEWATEDDAKKALIEDAFIKFIDKVIEIDMSFPNSYRINDISPKRGSEFHSWMLKAYNEKNCDEIINNKFSEIIKRLNINISI